MISRWDYDSVNTHFSKKNECICNLWSLMNTDQMRSFDLTKLIASSYECSNISCWLHFHANFDGRWVKVMCSFDYDSEGA